MRTRSVFVQWGFALLGLILVSCNRDFENKLQFPADTDTTKHQLRDGNKVLYVIVDGGVGAVLEAEALKDDIHPNLYALTKNALYTGGSVADSLTYAPTTYADMLTGVDYKKHQVGPGGNGNLADYPAVPAVLKNSKPALRTAAFVRAPYIFDHLLTGADQKQLLNSDTEAQKAVVDELKRPEAAVVITQYQGLQDAGQQFGYGPRVPQYVAAVKPLDDFLGVLRTALRSRPTYASENWLIVVASNKGGVYALYPEEDDDSPFTDTERNTFLLLANDNFVTRYIARPNTLNYQQEGYIIGDASSAVAANTMGSTTSSLGIIDENRADVFNLGTAGGYTIQLKVYMVNRGSNLPAIFSKSSTAAGNSPNAGWAFVLHSDGRNDWDFRIGGTSCTAPAFGLNTWNTFTARIYDSASKRWLRTYTNGVPGGVADITGKNGTTVSPLRLGGVPSYGQGNIGFNVVDVRIYNTALPESYILSGYCGTMVNPGDPYYASLIGYWPGMGLQTRERSSNSFIDMSPGGRDIVFPASFSWTSFTLGKSDAICPTVPYNITEAVPVPVDLPLFIYSWMGVSGISSLNLDSRSWMPAFDNAQ
ncbi:LamG-like jellyroll fold domain-containing protein [Niabella beijingensis]|uniref:LamG-like jellyroll fold domain-containing protein n=1 Tax=Niabella beijingensis TaxID=2872700 RepID=UPI001CBD0FCD|nr:LamG-like jellyroll fold domain-containing protein [Niabella beijingensis]MBZ4188302.1 DUF4983 domain-containing protein [Niabella beijingensis]